MTEDRAVLLALSGDLDLSRRQRIRDILPSPTSVERLVIDCSAVTSIESVVIAEFMRYRRRFIAEGHDPHNIIFIASAQVRRTFDIAGMSQWFTVISTPQEIGTHKDP